MLMSIRTPKLGIKELGGERNPLRSRRPLETRRILRPARACPQGKPEAGPGICAPQPRPLLPNANCQRPVMPPRGTPDPRE